MILQISINLALAGYKRLNPIYAYTFFLLTFLQINAQETAPLIKVDHLPIIVKDLKSAERKLLKQGFTIKPGYKHKNGITNSHIKFADSTALEIISISKPSDEISRSYQKFLEDDEGGTFLSFRINDFNSVKSVLEKNKIEFKILSTKVFNYIIFSKPELQHIFFIYYKNELKDESLFTTHLNNSLSIAEIVITGDDSLINLFDLFGGKLKFENTFRFGKVTVTVKKNNAKPFRVLSAKIINSSKELKEFNMQTIELY